VWQSLQVMLKDSVDRMHMVKDAKHDRSILGGQPSKMLANCLIEAAIGPLFVANKLRIGLRDHEMRLL
jgi:hypothetical protein